MTIKYLKKMKFDFEPSLDQEEISVCAFDDLDPLQQNAVLLLRLCSYDAQSYCDFAQLLTRQVGKERAESILTSFTSISALMVEFGRKQIKRHAPGCTCVGADECTFASILTHATYGDFNEALLIASTIIDVNNAPKLVVHLRNLGNAVQGPNVKIASDVSRVVH